MPVNVSNEYIQEKNRLSSSGAWITLAKLMDPEGGDPARFAFNTEDIEYSGYIWRGITINADSIKESRDGELPEVNMTIVDINRLLLPTLDAHKGGVGTDVYLYIVNSAHLDLDPILTEKFQITKASVDHLCRISLSLSALDISTFRSPPNRFIREYCRYKEFKGPLCQYDGPEETCDRTLTRCKQLGNQRRFGGFPGIGAFGYQKSKVNS